MLVGLHSLGCLGHLVLFGLESLRRAVSAYRDFHNKHRPHQGLKNRIPGQRASGGDGMIEKSGAMRLPEVARTEFLGGLLKSYSWKAA